MNLINNGIIAVVIFQLELTVKRVNSIDFSTEIRYNNDAKLN